MNLLGIESIHAWQHDTIGTQLKYIYTDGYPCNEKALPKISWVLSNLCRGATLQDLMSSPGAGLMVQSSHISCMP